MLVHLEITVHLVTLNSDVPVHLVTVEVGAVHAGELHLAAHAQAAAAAHTGAVHHDGTHGNGGGDAVGLGGQGDKLHHDHRADGEHLVILVATLDQFLQRVGHQALAAIGTIVSADDQLIAGLLEVFLQNDQILAAEANDGMNLSTVIVGFRSKDIVILEEEFKAVADRMILMTDDGSYGRHGLVTQPLKELLEAGEQFDEVLAIGPIPMMKFVSLTTLPFGVHTSVSLNPIMVDGTGMCGGCRVTVGGETKFACVDGPEFDGHKVDFAELMKRNGVYRGREAEVTETHACRMDAMGKALIK